jgi:glycerophosphoryl diester phosphodiesterase
MTGPVPGPMVLRTDGRPLAIAHRAGNDPTRLRLAEEAGVDLVEADVWLHRGRLEVRHEKTAGPLPVLWERWSLAPGWTARRELADLLHAASPTTVLMLDLKGRNPHLPRAILALIDELAPGRPFAVSARRWKLLDPFRERPEATTFPSAGTRFQLRALTARLDDRNPQPVSIHSRLLDAQTVRTLKERAAVVVPWKVRTLAHARQLLDWGVDGINADDLGLLRDLLTPET